MARRRKAKTRRSAYRGFMKRKSHKASKGLLGGEMGIIIGGAAYGAGRQYVAKAIEPLTSKIPLGNYADNIGMGLLSYFVAKGKIPLINKIPMSKEIGRAGLYIESAMLGSEILNKTTGTTSGSW
jgi:hypothetical protein